MWNIADNIFQSEYTFLPSQLKPNPLPSPPLSPPTTHYWQTRKLLKPPPRGMNHPQLKTPIKHIIPRIQIPHPHSIKHLACLYMMATPEVHTYQIVSQKSGGALQNHELKVKLNQFSLFN